MVKRIRKHPKIIFLLEKPISKEVLHTKSGDFPLNTAEGDRISFSILKNEKNNIRKIENVSFEINIDNKWEWVVRYDDHGGSGSLHRHIRISLKDDSSIETLSGIKKYKNKDFELTWIIDDIKRNYMIFRKNFLKIEGLDLYS